MQTVGPYSRNSQHAVDMDEPNITMEEYIRLEEEKARRRGKVYNWETATYGKLLSDAEFTTSESVGNDNSQL
ncbi:hypothetical protein Tco_0250629 [Tanacetum coccineum]